MATDLPTRPFAGEVENLRDSLPAPTGESVDPRTPRMPFVTSLILTREQEDALVEFACRRVDQLSDQLGRVGDRGIAGGRTSQQRRFSIPNPESFMGKRHKYTLRFYSHVLDRALPDTLFETSNVTANISQRIVHQMIAKAIEYFFGQPDDVDWFTTDAVGVEDAELAEKIKKHSRWKIRQCKIKDRLIEAVEYAFIRGESIVKPTHEKRSQIYKRTATILMDGEGKEAKPILDAHGDYIVQGDAFVPQMAPAGKPGVMQNIVAGVKKMFTGPEPGATAESDQGIPTTPNAQEPAPQLQPTGKNVLKRDGVTILPDEPIWNQQIITRELITFEGPDAGVLFYEDFLCSQSSSDIQTADLVAHLYDMNFMQVAQMFRGQYGEGDAAIKNMQAAIQRLREMSNASNLPKAAATQPRTDMKETDTAAAPSSPLCHIAESYLTYDCNGDGTQEEIMLVLDRTNKAPIFYDYLANVTVRGQRPLKVIRPGPVDQRWYGIGGMEVFDADQEFIDLQVNRYNFANSKAGRIDFWNPNATAEGRRDPNLLLNHGRTYQLLDGKKKEDAYDFVQIPFEAEHFEYLIEFFVQQMQTKGGVVSGRDQAMSGMPSQRTAAGINEITESGEELFGRILAHLFPGILESLQSIVDIIYANMNRPEVFTYFNGEATEVLTLSPDEVRDLPLHVTLSLTRSQKAHAVEVGQQAQALIQWFYSLQPELQTRVANYARQQLRSLGLSGVEEIIIPLQSKPNNQPVDKGSAVLQAVAAARKAGIPVTDEEVNAAMAKNDLPPLKAPIPTPQDEKEQEQATTAANQPAESAV